MSSAPLAQVGVLSASGLCVFTDFAEDQEQHYTGYEADAEGPKHCVGCWEKGAKHKGHAKRDSHEDNEEYE